MGIFWDFEQGERERQSARIRGLLGERGTPATINPIAQSGFNTRLGVRLPGSPGSGYLGGRQTPEDQARLLADLQSVGGLSAPQAMSILSPMAPEAQKPTSLMQNLQAAGVDLQTPEGQKTMLEAVMKPQTQVNMGGAGSIWKPEQVEAAGLPTGSVVVEDRYGKPQILNKEKYTQAQHVNAGYAVRMKTANDSINKIMANFPNFEPTSVRQHADKLIPDWMASASRSPEGQMYRQAQENWISANLRKESGAVLGEEEIEREMGKWFPTFGDSPDVIKQKAMARKDAENAMLKSSGGAYDELIEKSERDRLSELRSKHGTK